MGCLLSWVRILVVSLGFGILVGAVSAQQEVASPATWIAQLANPQRRVVAAVSLVRAGRPTAALLGKRLLSGWPSAGQADAVAAQALGMQVLLDLGADAFDAYGDVLEWYALGGYRPGRYAVCRFLARLAAHDPRAAQKILEEFPEEAVGILGDHVEWMIDVDTSALLEAIHSEGDYWMRVLAIDFVAERAPFVFPDEPAARARIEAALIALLEDMPIYENDDTQSSIATALALMGSEHIVAADGHVREFGRVDPRRRVAALRALSNFDKLSGWVMAAIVGRLDDADPRVVGEAVTTLGIATRHTPGCIGALERMADAGDLQARRRAQSVLASLRRASQFPEIATWWWPNGKISSRGKLRDGVMEGRWEFFWPNGYLRQAGGYRQGRAEGAWQFWYDDRRVSGEGSFAEGQRVGEWIFWYEQGGPKSEGVYENGLAQGAWIGWHSNGRVAWKGDFVDGERHGLWVFHHPNGALLAEGQYTNGERSGEWMLCDENGTALPADADIARRLGESKAP